MSDCKLNRQICVKLSSFVLFVFALMSFSIYAADDIPSWHSPSELLLRLDEPTINYSESEALKLEKAIEPQLFQSSSEISQESVGNDTDFTEDPHLIALARNLKNDPIIIYQFVKSKIQLDYSYGFKKGPLGTYLDMTGNIYDQAELLVTLLKISGYSAKYQFVDVEHSASDLAKWLKVYSIDNTGDEHLQKLFHLLQQLGVSSISSNSTDVYKFKHLVVQWNSDNGFIYLDPSYQLYDFQNPTLNLGDEIDFDIDYFRKNTSSESIIDRNEVFSELNAYSESLVAKINETDGSASIDEMVGYWKTDVKQYNSIDDIGGYLSSYGDLYDELPSGYNTTLRIRHRGIDVTLDSRNIYTNRLSIYYSENTPILYLNGEVLATGNSSNDGQSYPVTFNVNHPGSGDQNWNQYIRAGGAYTIINTWGSVGRKHISFQEKRLSELQNFGKRTEPLLNQSLMTMGLKWSRYKKLSAEFIGKVTNTNHFDLHTVGIAGTGDIEGIDGGPYVDVAGSFGGFNANIKQNFIASGLIASAFEHGVIEQNQPFSAVSTVKLFDLASRRKIPLYEVSLGNWSTIQQELENYSDNDLNSIASAINSGGSVLLPKDGSLTEDSWSGAGYFTFISSANGYSAGYQISGGLKGGFSTSSGDVETVIPTNIVDLQSVANVHPSVTRERLSSGDGLYSHDDLMVGAEKGAFKLTRTYNGSDTRTGSYGQGWRHNFNIDITESSEVSRLLESGTAIDATASLVATYVVSRLMDDVESSLFNSVGLSASVHQWLMNNYTDNSVLVSVGASTQQYIKLPNGGYSTSPQVKNSLKKFSGLYSLKTKDGTTYSFNSSNLASSIEDRNGNETTLKYVSGKLDTVENEYKRKLKFEYKLDFLSSVTESLSSDSAYTRTITFEYDDGKLDEFINPNGEKFKFRYDELGRLSGLSSPLYPNESDYRDTYDIWGKRVKRKTATGKEFLFYSETGFRNETVDAEGNRSVKYFDGRGDLALEINALGQKMTYGYDSAHRRVSTQFEENGIRIELKYDDEDNVIEKRRFPKAGSDKLEKVESYTHTTFGNIATHTSLDGEVTHYEYDDNGNLETITSPKVDSISLITSYKYYEDGSVKTETGPDGIKVEYIYDDQGTTKKKRVHPNDESAFVEYSYTYFPSGDIKTSTDPLGNITSYLSYDETRRLKRISSPSGHITTFSYDVNGNLVNEARSLVDVPVDDTLEHWAVTEYKYTRDGQLEQQIDSEGNSTLFGYDKVGNQNYVEDADGKKKRILFDALYRPTHTQQYVDGSYVDEIIT
ncbi:RHS repeat domain-containing protein, partial [Alteromonas lipotrueae]|uniref:RHS repeat domain-containing protein n=1 Tax=Alteromonas lipotrueae TaxID=2803814 RepID=UPI001C44D6C4